MPTLPQLTEYDEAVLRIARGLSLEAETDRRMKGRFSMAQVRAAAKAELQIALPQSPKDGPIGRLIAAGEIVQYPAKERVPGVVHGNGTKNVFRATSLDRVTLCSLMALAKESVDPDQRGRTGRKASTDRHVERISPAQFAKIRTMARHVAAYVAPGLEEEEAYETVKGPYLMWDVAHGIDGDWRPFFELVRLSRPPAKRLSDDLASAKTLLDLASTHGLLLRAAASERFVVPTHWAEIQEQWVGVAQRPGLAAVMGVNFFLGAITEVLGADVDPTDLTQDQTDAVVQHVQDVLHTDGSLTGTHKTSIRRSIRRLMEAGIVPTADVNSWDYRQRHRAQAWSQTVTKQIAAAVATEHRGDTGLTESGYASWRAFPFTVLADPDHPYSLAKVVDFHTAKGRERSRLKFRKLGSFPLGPARGDSDNLSGEYWGEATVKIRLNTLNMYLGWIARHRPEVDLQVASLADLLTPELVEAFVDAVDRGEWSTPDVARRTLITIGLITSPCLQDQALKEGDEALAQQFFEVSCLATGKGKVEGTTADGEIRWSGMSLYDQLGERSDVETDRVGRQRKQAEALEKLYRTEMGVEWAYDGLVLIYQAARAEFLQGIGAASMSEVHERWAEFRQPRPGRKTDRPIIGPVELEALRSLALVNFLLAAPLRTNTLAQLKTHMIEDAGSRLDFAAGKELFKVEENGDYAVNLWSAETATEDGFDSDLMRLYCMPGGVRAGLLNGLFRSDCLWTNSCVRSKVKRPNMLHGSLNEDVRRVIKAAGPRLGLTESQVKRLVSGTSIHSCRHAVAGRLVRLGKIEEARLLLHHAKYDTILAVYAGKGRDVSTSTIRSDILGGNMPSLAKMALLASKEELAELRRVLDSLDAGCV